MSCECEECGKFSIISNITLCEDCYRKEITQNREQGAVEELERKHKETLKIIYDVIGLEFSFKNKLIETLEKAQKERLKELEEKGV
jgi:hypothetical protein